MKILILVAIAVVIAISAKIVVTEKYTGHVVFYVGKNEENKKVYFCKKCGHYYVAEDKKNG